MPVCNMFTLQSSVNQSSPNLWCPCWVLTRSLNRWLNRRDSYLKCGSINVTDLCLGILGIHFHVYLGVSAGHVRCSQEFLSSEFMPIGIIIV